MMKASIELNSTTRATRLYLPILSGSAAWITFGPAIAAEGAEEDPNRVPLSRLEMEFVDKLQRIHTLSKRIARGVLPPELASRVD